MSTFLNLLNPPQKNYCCSTSPWKPAWKPASCRSWLHSLSRSYFNEPQMSSLSSAPSARSFALGLESLWQREVWPRALDATPGQPRQWCSRTVALAGSPSPTPAVVRLLWHRQQVLNRFSNPTPLLSMFFVALHHCRFWGNHDISPLSSAKSLPLLLFIFKYGF